jgi:signal peptidase I
MSPTLLAGDTIFVAKWPITLQSSYLPDRGDIVVYSELPDANAFTLDYIKRVIGIPGDTVSIRDGKVNLNGKIITSENQESLSPKKGYSIALIPPLLESFGPEKVPNGSVFVVGDLRTKDLKRKKGWGMVPIAAIKGKALWVWLSIDPIQSQIRWERTFRQIK